MTQPLQRILCVEDDPDIQTIARLSLERVGEFEVLICASGREALEAAPGFAPDLILLDVMMPVLDGPGTLAELRKLPACAQTPIVFVTARAQEHDVHYYRKLGAVDVINKPFDPMSFPEQIRAIWQRL
ncbi:MAG: response regulator [Chrysiogenetes bacterium]|nr:response regulator [Chrysiogenetes bacterium]